MCPVLSYAAVAPDPPIVQLKVINPTMVWMAWSTLLADGVDVTSFMLTWHRADSAVGPSHELKPKTEQGGYQLRVIPNLGQAAGIFR